MSAGAKVGDLLPDGLSVVSAVDEVWVDALLSFKKKSDTIPLAKASEAKLPIMVAGCFKKLSLGLFSWLARAVEFFS